MKRYIAKLSLVTAMLLSSGAYAGKIIGANPTVDSPVPLIQFGFEGWYLADDDVEVELITADGNTPIDGTFNLASGTYPEMDVGDSFISKILDAPNGTTVLAHILGKNFPVGEPAGIKIINGDTAVKHGKPENCIMTTSYLEEAYLDSVSPKPVICSSDFQTHKRFKVIMLPDMVDGTIEANGTSIDIKFELESGDKSVARYQVFQKINNYTGMRLNGYSVQVLDKDGKTNPNLTLSLGLGDGTDSKDNLDGSDIWAYDEFANFAHGLWGPPDEHFAEQGFFDDERVYYPVTLNDTKNTISYAGDLLGGNYQELFGNWLTNAWAPIGIFWDDDKDPSTDAELVAYWGDPLYTGTIGWHKGEKLNWIAPTSTELLAWETSPYYEMGLIEDVLNLGLNYIVAIGDNTLITDTFIIRITPHTDSNITVPDHVGTTPVVITPTSKGVVAISPTPTFALGDTLTVAVADIDLDTNSSTEQNITVVVSNNSGDIENVLLTETNASSAIFRGLLPTSILDNGSGSMTVAEGTRVTAYYTDVRYGADGVEENLTAFTIAQTIVVDPIDPLVDTDGNSASSGGGGCTYNPNSKNSDMMFLLMMVLGLSYLWRRRFLK